MKKLILTSVLALTTLSVFSQRKYDFDVPLRAKSNEGVYEWFIEHLDETSDSLVNELHLITNEITDLNSNINELTSNYYLNTKKLSANTSNLMFLRNRYGVTIFQFNKFVNEMKENVKTIETEKKIILSTIEITTAQLNEVNHKIEEYLYH